MYETDLVPQFNFSIHNQLVTLVCCGATFIIVHHVFQRILFAIYSISSHLSA